NDQKAAQAGNYLETHEKPDGSPALTIAGPYLTDTMPHSLLSTGSPISNPARLLYEGAGCPVDTDLYNLAFVMHQGDGTLTGEREFDGTNPLGDPVVFSTYLIGQLANNPKNFLSSFN